MGPPGSGRSGSGRAASGGLGLFAPPGAGPESGRRLSRPAALEVRVCGSSAGAGGSVPGIRPETSRGCS